MRPPQAWERRDGRWVRRAWAAHLTSADLVAFDEETDVDVDAVVPGVGGSARLRYGKTTMNATFYGTSEDFHEGRNWPVVHGRPLTADDVQFSRKVCTIGQKVRTDLFGGADPIGLDLKLNGERYTVVGVLEERVRFGREEGNQVLIPYTTAQRRLLGNRRLDEIALFLDDVDLVEDLVASIELALRRHHEHGDEFQVETSANQLEQVGQTILVMKGVAGGIAGISLLVGGIGIMNIMLVSVTERTREIGVRKALGAKSHHIMMQFVAEAIVLSLFGGLLGVGVGVGFGLGIEQLISHFDENTPFVSIVSADSVLVALAFASAVGLFFGVYPAARAARLDPVEALRHE
ncbi:MAG: hypothetical protein CME04_02395 [Gemmatimonadaceae bacterium]|nr:hypothetical protein [Gemmatimonadaceae bacterium]